MVIKSVFILGSTSLIAKELCLILAKKGCKRFHLISRDYKKNEELVNKLRNNYEANVTQEIIDLNNSEINSDSLPYIEDFDLYLITAGTLGNNKLAEINIKEAKKITNVNYYSLIPWIMSIANEKRLNTKSNLYSCTLMKGGQSSYPKIR